jgi:hypothetical protein
MILSLPTLSLNKRNRAHIVIENICRPTETLVRITDKVLSLSNMVSIPEEVTASSNKGSTCRIKETPSKEQNKSLG